MKSSGAPWVPGLFAFQEPLLAVFLFFVQRVGRGDDNRVGICKTAGGLPFAIQIFIRIDDEFHAVLMPAFDQPDAAAAYYEFLNNDRETLHFSHAYYDAADESWQVSPKTSKAFWPKKGDTFDF